MKPAPPIQRAAPASAPAAPPADAAAHAEARANPARASSSTTSASGSSLLPVGHRRRRRSVSPDGKTLLVVGRRRGPAEPLHVTRIDELSREPAVARQLTSTAGAQERRRVHARRQGGLLPRAGPHQRRRPSRTATRAALAVTAEMDVDFAREKMEVFQQAWSYLRDNFFDAEIQRRRLAGGARALYAPLVAGARDAATRCAGC